MPISDDDLAKLSAEDVERVYAELARRRAPREVAPRTHAALLAALPKLPPEVATEVRADLDAGLHPLAVVVARFGDKPALGAFPKPELPVPDPVAWFGATRLLEQSVREMQVFTKDRRRVVDAAIELADQLGVPQAEADAIIAGIVNGGRNATG
jgi:hypothetical protein